jgi:hypothetical protein
LLPNNTKNKQDIVKNMNNKMANPIQFNELSFLAQEMPYIDHNDNKIDQE